MDDYKTYEITCWASEKIVVKAKTKEEAEELATEKCIFPYVDYLEVEELEDEEIETEKRLYEK